MSVRSTVGHFYTSSNTVSARADMCTVRYGEPGTLFKNTLESIYLYTLVSPATVLFILVSCLSCVVTQRSQISNSITHAPRARAVDPRARRPPVTCQAAQLELRTGVYERHLQRELGSSKTASARSASSPRYVRARRPLHLSGSAQGRAPRMSGVDQRWGWTAPPRRRHGRRRRCGCSRSGQFSSLVRDLCMQ